MFHRIAAAEPDRLTLDELDADLAEIAATYATVPHAVAAPRIIGGWRQVEAALYSRTSASAHARLTLLGSRRTRRWSTRSTSGIGSKSTPSCVTPAMREP
ncbi:MULTISPECIES: hypothetical protein [unclassified Frankia]|uniref:hypothetical protein n=1 Tax=unclassified Frankia TaxID=2632575 RepID=UPI002AD2BB0E|nr:MULTISPECIES: hypothetical protein [unclassified Frankia]